MERGEQRKAELRNTLEGQQAALRQFAATERQRLLAGYDLALQRIDAGLVNSRTAITAHRDAKVAQTRRAAQTALGAADEAISQAQATLIRESGGHADQAVNEGGAQATRAIRECQTRADQAHAVGGQKVAQYQNANRAGRIASVARRMASELAAEINGAGAKTAAAVRKDASQLAAKFRKEGKDGARKLDESRGDARRRITQERDSAVRGIEQAATDSINGLERGARQATTHLQGNRQASLLEFDQLTSAAGRGLANALTGPLRAIDDHTAQACAALDAYARRVDGELAGVPSAAAQPAIGEAQQHAAQVVAEHETGLDELADGAATAITQGAGQVQERLRSGTDSLLEPVVQTGANFEEHAARTAGETANSMQSLADEARTGMDETVGAARRAGTQAVDDSRTAWASELAEGRREMREKVDAAVTQQDTAVRELGRRIDKEARRISEKSWWRRGLSWLGGIVSGFFKELWSVVKFLLIAALVILAVVAVIALIIFAIGGLALLAKVVLAVAAAIAAAAKVIGIVLLVLAGVGLLVGLLIAAWRFYQAGSRDDLSDFERGEYAGRGLFDVLSSIVPGKVFFKLAGWLRLRRLIALAGGQARFSRLMRWAGGDLAAVEAILRRVRDPVRIDRILAKTADVAEFERLLARTGGNSERLERLLMRVDDGAGLARLLDKVDDAARLERMLTLTGNNARQLERFLEKAGGRAGSAALDDLLRLAHRRGSPHERVERLLDLAGGNAAELRRLTDAAGRFRQARVPGGQAAVPPYGNANLPHFLERHTYAHFDFSQIKPTQSFFPDGTTAGQVETMVRQAVTQMQGQGITRVVPQGHVPGPGQVPGPHRTTLPNGIEVQFGTRGPVGGPYDIGQFFPVSGTGVESFSRQVMQAIAAILNP